MVIIKRRSKQIKNKIYVAYEWSGLGTHGSCAGYTSTSKNKLTLSDIKKIQEFFIKAGNYESVAITTS